METIVERCCGLDVHRDTVVACVLTPDAKGRVHKQVRTFPTFTRDLLALRDWLTEQGVTHVGLESTGVYWRPIYAALEGAFVLLVGNAQHIKQVPGRKTDVKDSEWLARLVRCGLIRPSFVPPAPQRALRELVRYRRKLVEGRTAERNRLQKLLETANLKLASVASDVFGKSGLAMVRALAAGERDPKALAALACGVLRKKRDELERALEGRVDEEHRFLLGLQLRRLDRLDEDLAEVEARVETLLAPLREAHARLQQIPGVGRAVAAVVLAELGPDMSAFGGEGQVAKWAGLCPGNNESAGKHRSGRVGKGNALLKTTLVEAAQAASRAKGTYFREKFGRLRARRGVKRALLAIAHKLLCCAYRLLRDGVDYRELGEGYLDRLDQRGTTRRLQQRLERLGFEVTLTPKAA
jgi:transposase